MFDNKNETSVFVEFNAQTHYENKQLSLVYAGSKYTSLLDS